MPLIIFNMKSGLFACLFLSIVLFSCGGDEGKNPSDGDGVTIDEFINSYPEVKLPLTYSDTSLSKKNSDSAIARDVFYRFVEDSVFAAFFGKGGGERLYSVGRFHNGEEETYLITKAIAKDKSALLVSAFDKTKKIIATLPVIRKDKSTASSSVQVSFDPKFNINKSITRKMQDGQIVQGHDVFILNGSSKKFMLIMTDSLGEASGELLNPIDTLPKNQKFTGDYGDGKLNLISFRDGQREGRLHFFISLKNDKAGCEGELKGEVNFVSPTTAEYRQGGDPCILQFVFSNSNVKVQEVEGCGSRLGTLECTFNGVYPKHKPAKATQKKTEKLNESRKKATAK